ncbi:nucleoside-triphosphatase [Natronococcus occultus]|uniref:Putative nucleotide kinase n=1 Tax=Natronococcus occultus SP4 TaxID=694430 RepID=L0K004_9EURY|nr:nucleoside-triphosphatase [Natronococcus occultus]AGB37689.1 putative nucleotide kinase [Natronococcus occultus SP4]
MPRNALVTGPPRSGKTTALERTVAVLRDDGKAVGGLVCPELREDGDRVGFEIVDLATGERAVMAHVDVDGPAVSRYGVDVAAVGRLSRSALSTAVDDCDCVVIDELAPMQLESDQFVTATRRVLDSRTPVLASIAVRESDPFLESVRSREDVAIFAVTPETRDALPAALIEWIRSS